MIEDYFAIGDQRTVALVSNQGSIDWLCLPYFDSPSVFGKILDPAAGCFAIDMPGYDIDAHYVTDTAIVSFNVSKDQNHAHVNDFMVPKTTTRVVKQQLVRRVTGIKGSTTVNFNFQPAPEYGKNRFTFDLSREDIVLQLANGKLAIHLPRGANVIKSENSYTLAVPVKPGESKDIV